MASFAAGSYWGTISGGVVGESSKGNPQMVVTFNVTHQAANGEWQPIEPTDRRVYLSLTSAAQPYTREKLARLGFNNDFRSPDFGVTDGVELVCKHESYEGQQREKWDLAGNGPSEVKPASSDTIRKLQAQWDARGGAVQRPSSPAKPTSMGPQNARLPQAPPPVDADEPPPSEDQIPF